MPDEFERRINAQIAGYPADRYLHTKEILRDVLKVYKETRPTVDTMGHPIITAQDIADALRKGDETGVF